MRTFFLFLIGCFFQVGAASPSWADAFMGLGGETFSEGNGRGAQLNMVFGRTAYCLAAIRVLRGLDEEDATDTRPAKRSIYPMLGAGLGMGIPVKFSRLAASIRLGASWFSRQTNQVKTKRALTGKTREYTEWHNVPGSASGGYFTTHLLPVFKETEYNIWKHEIRPTAIFMFGPRKRGLRVKTKMVWVAIEYGTPRIFPGHSIAAGLAWGAVDDW